MAVGSAAIDQALRIVADRVERGIARYRMLIYSVVMTLTGVLRVARVTDSWIPTLFFATALVYAVAVAAFISRRGNARWLVPVVLVVDLVTCIAPFHILQLTGSAEQRAFNASFMTYIVAPALVALLLINGLRSNAIASLVGAIIAIVLFVLTVPRYVGFHPAQISVGAIILLAGVIGMAGARQAKSTLDSFARLELLRRYLPPEAVERVMRDDPDQAMSLGGRLVTVTLLAADLRGFTAMSETLSPSEVMAQLNAYHGAMIEVIDRNGGAIDKFIGDGTLVVFGLVGDARDGAASAVRCAKEMLLALADLNETRASAKQPPLRIGVGVHTGPVIAGNLGVPGRRLEFTVIGDAVNTASRLEGETKASGCAVIISSATADLLADTSDLRELAPASLRGKTTTVRVFGFAE